jgi:outer membrane lipopolysaccharide assembly protein LptE/RlpB
MPDDHIQQLLDRIQRLRNDQVRATEDAVYLGVTPRVATECEYRRDLISKLVDRLAGLYNQRSIDATSRCPHPTPRAAILRSKGTPRKHE